MDGPICTGVPAEITCLPLPISEYRLPNLTASTLLTVRNSVHIQPSNARNLFWTYKQSHYRTGQALRVPEGKAHRFQYNRHTVVRLSAKHRPHLTPRKYSWHSLLSEAESTPVPQCGQWDYVNEKFQWHHRESNPRPSHLQRSVTSFLYILMRSMCMCALETVYEICCTRHGRKLWKIGSEQNGIRSTASRLGCR
jgi:hypothetical protein